MSGDKAGGTAPRDGAFGVFRNAADSVAIAAAYAAAACLAALVALVTAEILMALLSRIMPGLPPGVSFAWEYSAYLLGASFMLGSGLTLRAGMHIRVELLMRAAGGRLERFCEIASALVGAAFTALLAWSFTAFTFRSYWSGQVSSESLTPLWIPQAALAAGAGVLALQMVLRLAAAVLGEPVEDKELGVATLPE